MKLFTIISLATLTLYAPLASAQHQATQPNVELLSLRNELKLAISRGNKYLKKTQTKEGYWHDKNLPAFTALAVYAAQLDPNKQKNVTENHIKKAYSYIESKVHKDGGIYGKGLATYNTSLCIMALAASGEKRHTQTILNARHFLINLQTKWADNPDGSKNIMNGGIGYGGSYPHSDMSNTHLAIHAIRTAENFAKDSGQQKSIDLDWDVALQFISSCQNLETTNPLPESGNDGSFVYFPGNSKAGLKKDKDGRERLVGYGSMSYAGLLSLIHAKLNDEDPRVIAVKAWLQANYTLEENPGLGKQGLYYYYHTMAKALSAAKVTKLKLEDNTLIDWRQELAKKLLSQQREDGSWVNSNARWLETQPDLVTSYAVLTLEQIYYSIPETIH